MLNINFDLSTPENRLIVFLGAIGLMSFALYALARHEKIHILEMPNKVIASSAGIALIAVLLCDCIKIFRRLYNITHPLTPEEIEQHNQERQRIIQDLITLGF